MANTKKALSKVKKLILTFLGFICVSLGVVGIVIPGLPTTVFMIIAAWLFSISNPRFEKWLLGLPKIGPAISNYREGLGMPKRAKYFAVCSIVVFCSLATIFLLSNIVIKFLVAAVGVLGICYITIKVPTRKTINYG